MKLHTLIYILLAGCVSTSMAATSVQITASKKTADKRKSSTQNLPKGSTYLKESLQYYEIQLRNMNPNNPNPVEVSWIVLIEGADGRLKEGTRGKKNVELPFGRPVVVETENVKISERVIDRKHKSGSIEEKIAGYGIRVRDESGNLLAERYSSKSFEKELETQKNMEEKKDDKQVDRKPVKRKKRLLRRKP